MTVFEHPLSERVRMLLRLQQLFIRLDHHLSGLSRCDLQASIGVLLEIYGLTTRSNLKTEVIKELEQQEAAVIRYNTLYPDKLIDSTTITTLRTELHQQPVRSYQQLQHNEFLNSVKQRCGATVSGSTYDLPLYHFWLDREPEECRETIIDWMQPYSLLRQAIDILLVNIRNSCEFATENAERGFYQNSLSRDKTLQLVRVQTPESGNIYPEISAGIHRITIRFMRYDSANDRPTQELSNTKFLLAYCTF